ncbi:hypothetical protein GCM10007977_007790 [Dactylosporangium sucinum]|uniref:Uncharacterized protein n=1 Tax=Dactylosporangium sucinum TaxID=1424081 RepID=A0A917T3B2_9ACTN|nr:hypothetical protein GCM10007977_007790 [Dactylosporangium sucinum]
MPTTWIPSTDPSSIARPSRKIGFICTVPAFAILGDSRLVDVIGGTHLLIGYATLGVILAAKPRLTGAR